MTKKTPKIYIFAEDPPHGLRLEHISARVYENGLEVLDSKGQPARFFPFSSEFDRRVLYGDIVFAVMTTQGELKPIGLNNSPAELAQYFEPIEQKRAAQLLVSQLDDVAANIQEGIEVLQSAKIGGLTRDVAAIIETVERRISDSQVNGLFPSVVPQRVFHVSFGGSVADNPPMTLRVAWPGSNADFLAFFDGGAEKCCISPALAKKRKLQPRGEVTIQGIEGVQNKYDLVAFPLVVEGIPMEIEAAVHPNTLDTGFPILLDRLTYREANKKGANITLA